MPYEGDTKQLLWKGQKLWPIYYKIPWDLCQKEEQGVSGCVLSHADRAGGSGTSVVTSQLRASGTAAAPKGQGWETPACPKEPVKTYFHSQRMQQQLLHTFKQAEQGS